MELSSEIDVQVAKGLGGVKPNMQLIYVFIYHVRSTLEMGFPQGCVISDCIVVSRLGWFRN